MTSDFGSAKATNESGSFEIEIEDRFLDLTNISDNFELTIAIPSNNFGIFIGEHDFKLSLKDAYGATKDYEFTLNF